MSKNKLIGKAATIFLCHSSKDNTFVRNLANDLKSNNVPVWFDEWELQVGDSLNDKIEFGIIKSGWLGVIISNNSVRSKWVKKELNAALAIELERKQIFVLPILLQDCQMPIFLQDKVYADFRGDYDKGFESLLKKLVPKKRNILYSELSADMDDGRLSSHLRPESLLIKIIEERIEGKDRQYPALFNVIFKLDQYPNSEWVELFQNPTQFTCSLHKPAVVGDEIHWKATEANIRNDKHWILTCVEDANIRFYPVMRQRIIQQGEENRKQQLENEKIAALENILKGKKEGINIEPTNGVMVGLCTLRLEGCEAPNAPGPITQVDFEHQGHMYVCFNCLELQIKTGHWKKRQAVQNE